MRRTLLFLPGNNPGNLQSSAVFGADGIILDLEDSVSPAEKDAARLLVASALMSVDYAGVERAVRINTLAAGGEADIAAVVPCCPDAVMLPKTESIDDIRACEALLEKAEAACGATKKTLIMPLIETPMGLARCLEIALASKRVTLLSLGGEDYTASLGTQRTREGRELIFARGMLANAAAAAGIDSIDAPFADTNDPEGLFLDTLNARTFGFKGKFAINPRQISVIHKAFAPTAKEIAWAKRILVVIEEAQKKGAGVIALDGIELKPFAGAFAARPSGTRAAPPVKCRLPGDAKCLPDLDAVFTKVGLKSGMTLSFHHHFRNGDMLMNQVIAAAAKRGIKDLRIAASSIFPVHAPLVEFIRSGVITRIDSDYVSGPVAEAVSSGLLPRAAVFRTHGGRARAIECGDLKIDVAFIAAPSADAYGNINGVTGETACGSLGYAFPDADYADQVVAVTDNLQPYPLTPISISQERVDWVVELEKIGDPNGIVSGTTKVTKDPVQLIIAQNAAKAIAASGLLQNGFSLQTGAGGASLAAAAFIAEMMREKHVVGSFIMGGITGLLVKMLEEGLFKRILDVQDFDLEAVRSVRENPAHAEVGACLYASPFNSGCIVNQLDCAILGATEIDTDFNVNVLTGSAGAIMGGSGGHSDAAAGAKMTIITANLTRSRIAVIKDRVRTICTPGETVDVLVTEWGIAVNPRRTDLLERFKKAKLPVHSIEKLREKAERLCGKARPIPEGERIVGIVEYRDGTIIDVVRARA